MVHTLIENKKELNFIKEKARNDEIKYFTFYQLIGKSLN